MNSTGLNKTRPAAKNISTVVNTVKNIGGKTKKGVKGISKKVSN